MKRNVILLLASGALLAGCNVNLPINEGEVQEFAGPKAEASSHVTYLVLSKVGRYEGNAGTEKDDSRFLENFIAYDGAAGSALPGEDKVTATSGAKFAGWVSYEGTGALTYYTQVPEVSGKILYAYFEGNGSGSSGSDIDPSGINTKYGIRNVDTGEFVCALNPTDDKDMQGRDQAVALNVSFKAGTHIQLYDTENSAGWIVTVDSYSFGASGDATKVAAYLTAGTSSWTVVKDFTADVYAKFKMNDDQIYFGLK